MRPPRPKRGALPNCATSRNVFSCQLCSAPTVLPLTKTILNCFCSAESNCATSRNVFSCQLCSAPTVLPLTKTILNCFCSAESNCATSRNIFSCQLCSAPTVLPLTKQYLIVLFGRVKLRHIPMYLVVNSLRILSGRRQLIWCIT